MEEYAGAEYPGQNANDEAAARLFAEYRRAHYKKIRLTRRLVRIQHLLATGGRAARRPTRHAIHYQHTLDDYFGQNAEDEFGNPQEYQKPRFELEDFQRRFRMGPKTFARIQVPQNI